MEEAAATPSGSGFKYEAFISHTTEDRDWAYRLHSDLEIRGVTSIAADFTTLDPSDRWSDVLDEALEASRVLVVLWTPRSIEANGVRREVTVFDRLTRRARPNGEPARLIIPIFFGENALNAAPPELQARQGPLIESDVYSSGPDTPSPSWTRAVDEISRVLLAAKSNDHEAATEQPSSGEQLNSEFPPEGLKDLRTWVLFKEQTETGWLLGGDLVITTAKRNVPGQRVAVRTEAGMTNAIVEPWPPTHAAQLVGFAALRLDPALEPILPLPLGPSAPGLPIELWEWPLRRRVGSGELGVARADDTYDLELRQGSAEPGAAAWDTTAGRLVGIVIPGGPRGWRIMPVETLHEIVGSSTPVESAPPPSARIHDDRWTIDDRLDYALYGRAIKEFILHPDTKPPLVIGVQGPWGQGKTSLMRIAQNRLDPGHADLRDLDTQPAEPVTDGPSRVTFRDLRDSLEGDIPLKSTQPAEVRSVWFNAWKYQSNEALWAGLAHAILTQLPARLPRHTREMFWLKLQLRRIDGAAVRRDIHRAAFDWLLPRLIVFLMLAVVVIVALAAEGASAAVSALGGCGTAILLTGASWVLGQRKALSRNLEGSYLRYVSQPDYSGRMGYLHEVEEDMHRALGLLTPDDKPTVIFIDDLDRCSPARIGEILEAINLFLSGEYPNCVFVLGIDAKVVAGAMEVVHKDLIGELGGEHDKLGWRFMDKLIQLSFVMPRLSERQKEAYLMSLLGAGRASEEETANDRLATNLGQIDRELGGGGLKPEEAARRLGELAASPATVESNEIREAAENVIALGARDFSDADPETVEVLRKQLPHLSDNPRTIKRAVNLYRFYRFIAWARAASSPDLKAADPELVARWSVIAARWPQVVHWLQLNGRDNHDPQALLRKAWHAEEPELCAFLEGSEGLDLSRAKACGLW